MNGAFRFGIHNQRSHARLEVLRGFDPTQPTTFTQTAPVKTGVTILSGQAIVLEADDAHPTNPGQLAWALADHDVVAHRTAAIFIAQQDSADEDIGEAGGLTGFDTAGQFEFESAFYVAGTYTPGTTYLSISTTAGSLGVGTVGSGVAIVGRITRTSPKVVGNVTNSNVPAGSSVIVWRTGYLPNPA